MLGKVHDIYLCFDPNINIVLHFNNIYTTVEQCTYLIFFVLLMFFWFLEDVFSRAPDVWHLLRNCEHIYFVAGTDTIVNL